MDVYTIGEYILMKIGCAALSFVGKLPEGIEPHPYLHLKERKLSRQKPNQIQGKKPKLENQFLASFEKAFE